MKGRRREDTVFGEIPTRPKPGDYWKYLNRETLKPVLSVEPQNLTGTVWGFVAPERGFGIAKLMKHTVREHDDGTISVQPGDGSSNSILVTGAGGKTWHGFIDHGTWQKV